MIIIKVINQKVVQVALAGAGAHQVFGPLLATTRRHQKQQLLAQMLLSRTLVQSNHQNQMVTNANNQQLVPIARNISFRQCPYKSSQHSKHQTRTTNNAKASFSIHASSPYTTSEFVAAPSVHLKEEEETGENPLELLKRKTKNAVTDRQASNNSKYYGQSFNETWTAAADSQPKLVVLMSWLEAKEKHIEKYRQFYLERGFDVLNVKTSPWDLLLPNVGAKKISQDFVRFMVEKQYSNVVLHGFSVGGYMFGQVLLDIDRQEEQVRQNLLNSIRGLVFDSLVPFEGTCIGVANSITSNKLGAKVIENLIRLYLFLGHNIATKYYLESSDKVWGGPLNCPSLFLMSKDDKISDHKIVSRLIDIWRAKGIETHQVLFDSSPHVQIFTKHHDAYVDRVEKFLNHLNLK